jgi:hypothetical protein
VDPLIDSSCVFPCLSTDTDTVAGTLLFFIEYDTVDKVQKSSNTVASSCTSILRSEVVLCRSMLKLPGIRRTRESVLNRISDKQAHTAVWTT